MGQHVVGLDLGQAADYTALSVIERIPRTGHVERTMRLRGKGPFKGIYTDTVRKEVELPPQLHCRQLARAELGTKYPEIVSKAKAMLEMPELKGALLVADGTGVGRPVIDMFRAVGLRPIAVHITSGATTHFEDGYWYVPKRDLVAAVQVPLQDKRLVFTQKSPLNETLVAEMLNFKIKITAAAHDSYGAWREGEHDDLIFSVMLACWAAQRFKPRQRPTSKEY